MIASASGGLAVGLLALGLGAWAGPLEHRPPAEWLAREVALSQLDAEVVERRLAQAVDQLRPVVAAMGPKRPRIVALGASSSGGQTPGRHWPDVVGERLPSAEVVSLARVGFTTWHMVGLL